MLCVNPVLSCNGRQTTNHEQLSYQLAKVWEGVRKQTMQKQPTRTGATDENTRRKLNRSFVARRSNLRMAALSERLISSGHRRSADLPVCCCLWPTILAREQLK
jgi:hypothetical protein